MHKAEKMSIIRFCRTLKKLVEERKNRLKIGKIYHFITLFFVDFFAKLPLDFTAEFVVK
jgi:hypothetical protein